MPEEKDIIATLIPSQGIRTEVDTVYLYDPKKAFGLASGRYIEITDEGVINNTMPVDHTVDEGSINPVQGGAVYDAIKDATSTFVFEMAEARSVWEITHNLGRYPSVTVVDSAGSVQDAYVEYIDMNSCNVIMNSAFKGKAYLN